MRLASRPFKSLFVWATLFCAAIGLATQATAAAEGVVDFARDVKPILKARCYECHGGDSTEGLDLNDPAAISDYLTAGESANSDLFQRLVASDDTLMPPPDAGGPMSGAEIAVLKLWIDEGATWPEGAEVGGEEGSAVETTPVKPTLPEGYVAPRDRNIVSKLWGLHGWFHPAIVHFPVALLNVAALFVVLNFLFKGNFREFAFWCLLLGAMSSIVSCTMGWAFASEKSQAEADVFNHRWGGIAVAVVSSLMTLVALRLKSTDKGWYQASWQIGTLVAAAMVGIVGHQGGELVYGEGMYDKAIDKYFGVDAAAPAAETPASETPAAETPAAETPATETPATEAPAVDAPAEETPAAETPSEETPASTGGETNSSEPAPAANPVPPVEPAVGGGEA